jgi:hypothetical protein
MIQPPVRRLAEAVLTENRPSLLSREIDFAPLWRALRAMHDHPVQVVLGLGVFLRVWGYLANRPYWMDEGSLLSNLRGTAVLDFSSPLHGDQLAPIGFLVVERILVGLLGESGYATRLLVLVCGIASLFLFRRLAFRWLPFSSALIALILFAFSDDLVYYSSELKPYSSDLALSLAILLVSSHVLDRPLRRRGIATLGLLAAAAPWLSFPSSFVIVGCGIVLLIDRMLRAWWKDIGWLALIALAWTASFVLAYRASHALLHPATTMYVFWNFAFLRFPPRSRADLVESGGILLEVFVNPLNLVPSWCPPYVVVLPILLWLLGGVSLARQSRPFFLMLTLPILLALIAAAARKYPFHGRLLIELVPAFYLMIAAGTEWFRARLGRPAYVLVLILLLTYPCWTTLYEATGVRIREFNSHGDLHRNRFME